MSDYIDEIAPFTSDDWERMREIALKNRIGHLGLNPAPIEAAAQFQQSMLRLQEPLSLPENRTEETQQALMHWLESTTHAESHEVTPGVWKHTFTPGRFADNVGTGTLNMADLDAMIDQMRIHAEPWPHFLYVSVDDVRQIRHADRIGRLYRALPVPRRKIRKSHMRKLQARWRAGRAHIRRVELAERVREEAAMREARESR